MERPTEQKTHSLTEDEEEGTNPVFILFRKKIYLQTCAFNVVDLI
jgi:hypothetical protein